MDFEAERRRGWELYRLIRRVSSNPKEAPRRKPRNPKEAYLLAKITVNRVRRDEEEGRLRRMGPRRYVLAWTPKP